MRRSRLLAAATVGALLTAGLAPAQADVTRDAAPSEDSGAPPAAAAKAVTAKGAAAVSTDVTATEMAATEIAATQVATATTIGPAAVGTAVNGAELVGDEVYLVSRQLLPARFTTLDLSEGEVTQSVEVPTGIEGWAATAVNDGADVYFGMHTPADLYHYDTTTDTLTPEPVATFDDELLIMDQFADADDTIVLAGMAKGDSGGVYSFDPATGETRDYGDPVPGQRYVRSIVATADTIYAGMGTVASLEAIDRETGDISTVAIPELDGESFVYDIALSDTHLAFGTEPGGLLGVVDLADHSYEVVAVPDGRTVDAVAIDDDTVYFTARFAGSLYAYDIPTGELTLLATPSQGEEHRQLFVRDGTIIGVGGTGAVWTYDLATGDTDMIDSIDSGMPAGPERSVQSLAVVDGVPYVAGHWGVQIHDPAEGTSTRVRIPGEAKYMTGIDGVLYAAIYPAAQVWTYTPGDDGTEPLAQIGEEQMRPRVVHHDETTDSLLVGTRPVYGQLGGAVSVVDPVTGDIETYRNVSQDQSPTALTSRDGVAFVGTEIQGEIATPTTTEGRLLAWDIETQETLWDVVPVDGAVTVTSLATVPDAEAVYGTANDGTVFVADPDTGEIVYSTQVGSSASQLQVLDGVVYGLSSSAVFRIDPADDGYAVTTVLAGAYQWLAADDTSDTRLYATGLQRNNGVNEAMLDAIDLAPAEDGVYEVQPSRTNALFSLRGPDFAGAVPFVTDDAQLDAFGAWVVSGSATGQVTLSVRTELEDPGTEVASDTIDLTALGGTGQGWLEFDLEGAAVTPGEQYFAVLQAADWQEGTNIAWWGNRAPVEGALRSWAYDADYWGGWQEYGTGAAERFANYNLAFYVNDALAPDGCTSLNECWRHVPVEQSSVNPAGLLGTPGNPYALSAFQVVGAEYVRGSSVLELPDGNWFYLPADAERPVVVPAQHPDALAQIAESRAWLESGDVPGGDDEQREMAERALLDMRLLLQDNGAVAAAWHGIWKYSWPRDSSFTSVAFAQAGFLEEAYRILQFNASTQREDGTWEARTLLDGSGPPDARPWQLDANGFVPWATWQYLQVASDEQQAEAIDELYPMVRAAADYAADSLDENGIPPARPDYWESAFPAPNLGTAAPLLAGLRSAAAIAEMAGETEDAERWFAAADHLQTGIDESFGSIGYQRTIVDGSGKDSAIAWLAPPFNPADEQMWAELDEAWDVMLEPTGGIKPGENWSGPETWTPETLFFALAWANGGQTERAENLVDWMQDHRTEIGAFPEKVTPEGHPAAVATLGWTASIAVMTLASLEEPMPTPPTEAAPVPVPLEIAVTGELVAGQSVEVTVTGAQPGSVVTLLLGETEVGVATADAEGVATFSLPLPESQETVDHVLTAVGLDAAGVETSGTLTITVVGVELPTGEPTTEEPTTEEPTTEAPTTEEPTTEEPTTEEPTTEEPTTEEPTTDRPTEQPTTATPSPTATDPAGPQPTTGPPPGGLPVTGSPAWPAGVALLLALSGLALAVNRRRAALEVPHS